MSEAHGFMVLACLADNSIHTYKGFLTRKSAWDTVASVYAVRRPQPNPNQLMWRVATRNGTHNPLLFFNILKESKMTIDLTKSNGTSPPMNFLTKARHPLTPVREDEQI